MSIAPIILFVIPAGICFCILLCHSRGESASLFAIPEGNPRLPLPVSSFRHSTSLLKIRTA